MAIGTVGMTVGMTVDRPIENAGIRDGVYVSTDAPLSMILALTPVICSIVSKICFKKVCLKNDLYVCPKCLA